MPIYVVLYNRPFTVSEASNFHPSIYIFTSRALSPQPYNSKISPESTSVCPSLERSTFVTGGSVEAVRSVKSRWENRLIVATVPTVNAVCEYTQVSSHPNLSSYGDKR